MSRVRGYQFTQETHSCGRLFKAEYDAGEKIMTFVCPSGSRDNIVWGLELDCLSLEIACGCEAFQFRNSGRSKLNRQTSGAFAEHEAYARGKRLLPMITRLPKGCCPHMFKVRRFLKSHKIWPAVLEIEKAMNERVLTLNKKSA